MRHVMLHGLGHFMHTLLPLLGSSTSFSILAMSELIMPLLLPSPPPPAFEARGEAAACAELNF